MMAGRPGTVQPQGGIKEQLANIRKLIMEAQTLDDNGDELVCELLDTTTPSLPHNNSRTAWAGWDNEEMF